MGSMGGGWNPECQEIPLVLHMLNFLRLSVLSCFLCHHYLSYARYSPPNPLRNEQMAWDARAVSTDQESIHRPLQSINERKVYQNPQCVTYVEFIGNLPRIHSSR